MTPASNSPPPAAAAGDPVQFRLERIERAARGADIAWTDALARWVEPIARTSPVLSRLLVRWPQLLADVASNADWPADRRTLARALALAANRVETPEELDRVLRRFRHRAMLRIAHEELGGAPVEQTAAALSELAEAIVDVALAWWWERLCRELGRPRVRSGGGWRECRYCVIGMGKLGGRELNYSSDIDLVYFYETDHAEVHVPAGGKRAPSVHEFFTRLFRAATASVARVTDEGFCFRVDLRLRPEGSSGPICNSVAAAERYFEQWGQPWERLAWVRARPVAGARELGTEVLRALEPFVWPRTTDWSIVDEIARLKARIDAQARRASALSREAFDLKLGKGGIREIEFFVTALQLLYGGRMALLRTPSTLQALDRLEYAGILASDEARALADAYRFLRRVEHAVQMAEERQTHRLPLAPQAAEAVARAVLPRAASPSNALLEELERHRRTVSNAFEGLLAPRQQPGATEGRDPCAQHAATLLDPDATTAQRREALGVLGFEDPDEALGVLEELAHRPHSAFHPAHRGRFERLCLALLCDAARSASPDDALAALRDFVLHLAPTAGVYDTLEDNEPVRRLMMTLFGASTYLARRIVRRPWLLDSLVFQGAAPRVRSLDEMRRSLDEAVAERPPDDVEAVVAQWSRWQAEEVARIALLDVAGALEPHEVGAQLAWVAQALAEAVLAQAVREQRGEGPPLSVVGLGRLGACDMGYHSDLDVVFLYDAPVHDERATRAALRTARRFLALMRTPSWAGPLYRVDTRLRPDGREGALVTSLDAFRRYHGPGGRADWWERLAAMRWRHLAGDARVSQAAWQSIADALREPPPEEARRRIAAIRERQVRELTPQHPAMRDVKLGRGGIADIEYAVAWLQMRHLHRFEGVAPVLAEVLDRLVACHAIGDATADSARATHAALRKVSNRIRLVADRPSDVLDTRGRNAVRVARLLGYGGSAHRSAVDEMLVDLDRWRRTAANLWRNLVLEEGVHG